MKLKKHVMWVWLDGKGKPAYVGWGPYTSMGHPAKKLWAVRRGEESDLNDWLLTLKTEPERCPVRSSKIPLSGRDIRKQAMALRASLARQNVDLLTGRPYGTKAGGGARRAVLDPNGDLYISVRDAATAEAVNPCTVTRWCSDPESGWSYF